MWSKTAVAVLHVAFALQLFKAATTPDAVFHLWLFRPSLLQRILHCSRADRKGRAGLARLLGHSQLPFSSIYDSGCRAYMDDGRYAELKDGLLEQPSLAGLLMSVDCLRNSSIAYLTAQHLAGIGAPRSIFAEFPINDRAPPIIGHQCLQAQLHLAARSASAFPAVLQNCNWIHALPRASSFYTTSFTESLGPNGWMAFHHTCFGQKRQLLQFDPRQMLLVKKLVSEFPTAGFDDTKPDYSAWARWALHLVLVALSYASSGQQSNTLSLIIIGYLGTLFGAIPETHSGALIRQMIRAGCYKGTHEYAIGVLPSSRDLPSMALVLGLVHEGLPQASRPSWTLNLLRLYSKHSPGFWAETAHQELFHGALQGASALEHYEWTREYAASPAAMAFAWASISAVIKPNMALQTRLLNEYGYVLSEKDPQQHKLYLTSICFDRRLKFLRESFISQQHNTDSLRSLFTRHQLGRYTLADGGMLEQSIAAYLARAGALCKRDGHAEASLYALLTRTPAAWLATVLCIAVILGVRLPYKFAGRQLRLLLGFETDSTARLAVPLQHYFTEMENRVEDPSISSLVDGAIQTSRELILPLFSPVEQDHLISVINS